MNQLLEISIVFIHSFDSNINIQFSLSHIKNCSCLISPVVLHAPLTLKLFITAISEYEIFFNLFKLYFTQSPDENIDFASFEDITV